MNTHISRISAAAAIACLSSTAQAQLVIEDKMNGAASSYPWLALKGACLTAGNNTGSIPRCVGLPYYGNKTHVGGTAGRLPDAAGGGALRLTNGDTVEDGTNGNFQSGAVVSDFTFPTTQGLKATFTTVTYGGNNWGEHGADGMTFFLMDGSRPASAGVGATGGSLGYACSNHTNRGTAGDGVAGGYLGIGIDEYGNFANPADSTDTGPGFRAGRISVRGAGDTAWASLVSRYPKYYLADASVDTIVEGLANTCKTGLAWNYSGKDLRDATGAKIRRDEPTNERLPFNYPMLSYVDLPATVQLANQQAVQSPKRGNAVPMTYSVDLSQDGLLDVSFSVNGGTPQPAISKMRISSHNGPVPSSFRFGFAGSTGAGSNVHEVTCFKAAPSDESNSSASGNAQRGQPIEVAPQIYLALYHPNNWWGQLTAHDLVSNDSGEVVSIDPVANWDANCGLTGGRCAATGENANLLAPTDRRMLTWNGSTGIPFEWSPLSAAQKTAMTFNTAAPDARLLYLRGNRTREVSGGGTFRSRTGVLGDIVNSSPSWVGPPSAPYEGTWKDALYPAATSGESSYASFKTQYATRQNVVYVGANDGFLHGFRAGAYDASGTQFAPTSAHPNDGQETIAYMPAQVLSTIHNAAANLDVSNTLYAHNLFVDATAGTGDLYYGGAWHTWLVSGLGRGGNAGGVIGDDSTAAVGSLFALDITDPDRFSESQASSLVLGDWTSSTLTCANVGNCGNNLGSSVGTPVIRRLHNGHWAVLFGNGLNSVNGRAGLFIMLVNPADGARTFHFLDTGSGPSGTRKNGIAYVTPTDLDGDHITDYVYAGDLFGNVWRFDLTGALPAAWSVSSAPLFGTPDGQPVSSKVVVASVPSSAGSGRPRVVVAFGTGQQRPQTLLSAESFAAGAQALYGIWDWNMASWNAKSNGASQYESLPGPQSITASQLTAQTIASSTATRKLVGAKVCWKQSTTCTTGNDKFGWTIPLTGTSEQVVYNPVLQSGMFVVNTLIPGSDNSLTCSAQAPTGYTMAVTIGGGAAAPKPFFPTVANGELDVVGVNLAGSGSPYFVTARGEWHMVQQTLEGNGSVTRVDPDSSSSGKRINWRKVR